MEEEAKMLIEECSGLIDSSGYQSSKMDMWCKSKVSKMKSKVLFEQRKAREEEASLREKQIGRSE